ncbi:hypothetical protein COY65_00080 [Candidatus Jorgensenbacteria bacterium CG_4_10_14_0_8_um_filter_39_13]|uniref:Uncharacterized protein n=2 Tax=Candidatus Joergenseniibacteriota TaxID=1752739 RepID=A0A2M7RIL6_9BACT|nr:MAG: hypothetical protein COV54_02445 [Candidatus Jorgensenbacteria bacterium CG11_big_fil_rev_8_21_14_0_20_38_23]PIV13159.1 MAG: hypothetical protein COS46_01705 [Candidatus Jorgensenbacteria bacterium CG03_land_8_20_14_0_80_38_39]PIW97855.1 MAG: hypothetical protein COZ81_00330 [Candidatus Jorgensenbacteria bacterium CG_4_8_14_3_um_filter_38_10]PIY96608.1 MAG: hypothetical protein COY65_00080 [Candidatus Jorgensenbacteria bacterium CG_4_10_14_0_8_um_filter_39_13]
MPGDKNLFSSLGHTEFSKERDDEQKMEKLVEKARGILFAKSIEEKIQKEAGETLKEEEILGKGKEILNEEAREEINFIEQQFEDLLNDSKRLEEMLRFLEKQYGWNKSEAWAMLGVLRHGLNVFYYNIEFGAPDEETVPKSGARSLETVFFQSIAHDYSPGTAAKALSLVRLYLQSARELLKERKKI